MAKRKLKPFKRSLALRLVLWAMPGFLLMGGLAQALQREVRVERYADGSPRTRWEIRLSEDGTALRHGRFQRFHANGRLALEALYKDNKPVGNWSWWNELGGLIRQVQHKESFTDLLRGKELESGISIIRTPVGLKLAEGKLKGTAPHGHWQYYYLDGSLRAEGTFISGIPDGAWRHFYESGQLARRETYALGILHGPFLETHSSGQPRIEGQYDQGLKTGRWKAWAPNGQILSDGGYVEDSRHGVWREWDATGLMLSRALYASGKVVRVLSLENQARREAALEAPRAELPRLFDNNGTQIVPKAGR